MFRWIRSQFSRRPVFWTIIALAAVASLAVVFVINGGDEWLVSCGAWFIDASIPEDVTEAIIGMAVFVFVWWLAFRFTWGRAMRRRRGRAILTLLKRTVALSLPISPMLLAESNRSGAAMRKSLLAIRARLAAGDSLTVALSAVPEIWPRVLEQVAALESAGLLATHLRYVGDERLLTEEDRGNQFYRTYAIAFAGLYLALIVMLMAFVAPKFQAILRGSRSPLPSSLIHMISIADWFPLWLVLLCVVMFIAFSRVGERLRDGIIWRLPLFGERARSRGLARLFRFVADACEAGRPLDQALSQAAALADSRPLQARLSRWASAAAGGAPLSVAARQAGMPAVVAGMIGAVPAGDSFSATARFLADFYESKFSRLDEIARGVFIPALVLCMGAATLLAGMCIFEPERVLISANLIGGF
jgi:type II secretory pathway component PulF